MKRIIMAVCMSLFINMFFTGCSSLMGSLEVDSREVGSSVAAEETTAEGESQSGARINYTDEDRQKEMPDYFEQNMENRFKNLTGEQAFQIKDGHSKASEDLEDFQIGGLRDDRTFIYGYVTKPEDSGNSNTMVHCAAFYNYKSKEFQVFHENVYTRQEDEQIGDNGESFYIQVCDSDGEDQGDIFVFDNGEGYLYNSSGTLKFHADIEKFVRQQYPNAYSLTIVKALTDGNNRVYLELALEKEQIDLGDEYTDRDFEDADEILNEEINEDDLDEEAEKLDEEISDKVEEFVLVYEFKQIPSTYISQEDLAFENRSKAWIDMADEQEFEEAPDISGDWNAAAEAYPSAWGGAVLTDYEDLPVYQWKNGASFQYVSGMCNFLAEPMSYTPFTALEGNVQLPDVFIPLENHFNQLYGRTGSLEAYNNVAVSRTYILVWYETETNEDGSTTEVKHTQRRRQTIRRPDHRRAKLEQGYTESYWILDPDKITTLGTAVGNDILCSGGNGDLYWVRDGGEPEYLGIRLEGDYQIGALKDGENLYLLASGLDHMAVVDPETSQNTLSAKIIWYENLGGSYENGDSAYDRAFMEKNESELPEGTKVYSGGEYYTEENILRADMNVDQELAALLQEKEADDFWTSVQGGHFQGYLLTSQTRGLTYYDPDREAGLVLAEGSWYRSFKKGDQCISVGFVEGDYVYEGLDVAFARVYEYELDTLCREAMQAEYDAVLAEEAAESSRASEEASRESAEEEESVQDPMNRWDEEYKEKYTLPEAGEGGE